MASKAQATQTYVRPGQVRRQATCPDHSKQTSEFRGEQENMLDGKRWWAFHCRRDIAGYPKGSGHIFLALPDRSAPKTAEAAEAWQEAKQREVAGLEEVYDNGGR